MQWLQFKKVIEDLIILLLISLHRSYASASLCSDLWTRTHCHVWHHLISRVTSLSLCGDVYMTSRTTWGKGRGLEWRGRINFSSLYFGTRIINCQLTHCVGNQRKWIFKLWTEISSHCFLPFVLSRKCKGLGPSTKRWASSLHGACWGRSEERLLGCGLWKLLQWYRKVCLRGLR